MARWIPGTGGSGGGKTIPDWVFNPRDKILGIVTSWLAKRLVKGVLTVVSFVLAGIYRPFRMGAQTVLDLADIVVDGVGPAGTALIDTINTLNFAVASAIATTGLAAPVVVWVIQILELIVLIWVLREAIRTLKPLLLSFNPL